MPELPEVETIKSQISSLLPLVIVAVEESVHAKSLKFKNQFDPNNKTINSIVRIGKIIQFNLSEDCFIISGLGMTGNWRISEEPLNIPHKHFEFHCLKNGKKFFLSYVDPRRFGYIGYFDDKGLKEFYLRPNQMWKMLISIRSVGDLLRKFHGFKAFLDYFSKKMFGFLKINGAKSAEQTLIRELTYNETISL